MSSKNGTLSPTIFNKNQMSKRQNNFLSEDFTYDTYIFFFILVFTIPGGRLGSAPKGGGLFCAYIKRKAREMCCFSVTKNPPPNKNHGYKKYERD